MGGATVGDGGTRPPQSCQALTLRLWALTGKNGPRNAAVPPIVGRWCRSCLRPPDRPAKAQGSFTTRPLTLSCTCAKVGEFMVHAVR